jgi:hypothetical protein
MGESFMRFKSELPRLVRVAEGEFGTVYEVHGYTMRADPTTPLAYKEYKHDQTGPRAQTYSPPGAAAETAVEFRRTMASKYPSVCAEIDRYFAWPWEIVKEERTDEASGQTVHEVCGFLMPLAPTDFIWDTGRPSGRLRTLDWLAGTEAYWEKMGVEAVMSAVALADRLLLMTQLTFAFAVLHKQDWVVGDFSYTNAAFALNPPRLMLFDCDDAASLSDRTRHQPHTPNWYPPECEGPKAQRQQDHRTDVYKLGLAIVRCLKPGKGATTTKDVERLEGILDADGLELLRRALSGVPSKRPTARELYRYLKRITDVRIASPVIEYTELMTPVVMRGADGQASGVVAWRITNADKIEVMLGDDQPETVRTVTLADHADQCTFPLVNSGQVTVAATNRYGGRRRVVGDITIFEIPPITVDFTAMPPLDVPALQEMPFNPAEVAFPSGVPATPGVPDVQIPDVQIPEIQVPEARPLEFEDLLHALAPDAMTTPSPLVIADTVRNGVQFQVELIRAESERFEAGLRQRLEDRQREGGEAQNGQALLPCVAGRWRPGRGCPVRRSCSVHCDGRRPHRHRQRCDPVDVLRAAPRGGRGRGLVDTGRAGLGAADPHHRPVHGGLDEHHA